MAKLTDELLAVEDYIKSVYATSNTVKQKVPTEPASDTFVVRFQRGETESETAFHFLKEREYQLIYFGTDIQDTLTKMDTINSRLYNDLLIPLNDGSLRYMRVGSFSMSQPFETEGGLDAMIGVLQTELREARSQEVFSKIMKVYADIKGMNTQAKC